MLDVELNNAELEQMEDLISAIDQVGFKDMGAEDIRNAVAEESISTSFTKLVEFATKKLQNLLSLDEHVNAIASPEDIDSFFMELGSFLKELGCRYTFLSEGDYTERLKSQSNKIILLDYLFTELMAACILLSRSINKSNIEVTLNESSTARSLKDLLKTLKFPAPPADITSKALFTKAAAKLKEIVDKAPRQLIGQPFFIGTLSEKQWAELDKFQKELHEDYRMRREMLLKRLHLTVESFKWSDISKEKAAKIDQIFATAIAEMTSEPGVKISDILASREDLAILEKTSSASVRRKTKSDINDVVIGRVPDRGGRPYEQEAPPPEMPSWQKRVDDGQGRGGGGRGGSRGRGGFRQDFDNNDRRGGFDNRGGGYDNRGRNYDNGGRGQNRGYNRGGYGSYDRGSFHQGGYDRRGGFDQGGEYDQRGGYGDESRGYGNNRKRGNYSQRY